MRRLRQDRLAPEHPDSPALPVGRRRRLDRLHHLRHPRPDPVLAPAAPAGETGPSTWGIETKGGYPLCGLRDGPPTRPREKAPEGRLFKPPGSAGAFRSPQLTRSREKTAEGEERGVGGRIPPEGRLPAPAHRPWLCSRRACSCGRLPLQDVVYPWEMSVPGLEVLDDIRRAVITALFSVDAFYDSLVLKGGNALRLVYDLQARTSLDLDFSLDGDFPNFEEARIALIAALRDRLDSAGFKCFDDVLEKRPRRSNASEEEWGGYQLEFKVIRKGELSATEDLQRLRREALTTDARHSRKWSVQFSKFEYCAPKVKREIDRQEIFVYTPEMIVIEKLRALCQQMTDYTGRKHPPSPRARDFYDIHEILTKLLSVEDLQTAEAAELVRAIFEAKRVPISLLTKIKETREFHAVDWPSVDQAVVGPRHSFDHYFDFVVDLVSNLEDLWVK